MIRVSITSSTNLVFAMVRPVAALTIGVLALPFLQRYLADELYYTLSYALYVVTFVWIVLAAIKEKLRSPKRVAFLDSELQVVYPYNEKRFAYSEVKDVALREFAQTIGLSFKVAKRKIKIEVSEGQLTKIGKLIELPAYKPTAYQKYIEAFPEEESLKIIALPRKIEYRTIDEFETPYKREICQEAEQMIHDHLWWNEPFILYNMINYPDQLTGNCRISREWVGDKDGPNRLVDKRDDAVMAIADYLKVIKILSELSQEHDLYWEVFYTIPSGFEEPLGGIDNGKISNSLVECVSKTRMRYVISAKEYESVSNRKKIYSKYFDESDQPIF